MSTQIIDAVQKLGQKGMQAVGQNLVDAGILQIGSQLACAAASFTVRIAGHHGQIVHHFVQAAEQRARHVCPQNQQLSHTFRLDHVTVDFSINLKTGDAAQNGAPVIEVKVFVQRIGQIFLGCIKLDIYQPCRVVGTLQKSTQAQKVKRIVLQHGACSHAA